MTTNEIFDLLVAGSGWAYVNKANVQDLILIALERGDAKLEKELRNWS